MIAWLNEFVGKLLSLLACAIFGLILGNIVSGVEVADLAPWMLFAMAACVLGFMLTVLCRMFFALHTVPSSLKRQRQRPPAHLPEVPSPKPYDGRLAQFLDRPEEQLHGDEEPYISSMPFWSRFYFWTRSSPKSVSAIRVVLERIRRTVQGRWHY